MQLFFCNKFFKEFSFNNPGGSQIKRRCRKFQIFVWMYEVSKLSRISFENLKKNHRLYSGAVFLIQGRTKIRIRARTNSKKQKQTLWTRLRLPHSPGFWPVFPFPIHWYFGNSLLKKWGKFYDKKWNFWEQKKKLEVFRRRSIYWNFQQSPLSSYLVWKCIIVFSQIRKKHQMWFTK